MQLSSHIIGVLIATALSFPTTSPSKEHSKLAPKILSARTIYFKDQTGAVTVGYKTLDQIKKWGRFSVVRDLRQADLVLLLSADPYKGGHIATASGSTGPVGKNGDVDTDPIPNFNKQSPVCYAYLTGIDPLTEESLWGDSHQWGGLLTGFDGVGERLVKKLEKKMK
jgi:hypothetical protein